MTPNITDEQRKQIINWAQVNAGTENETFNEERYCGLIDGATRYCQQKDEEIEGLKDALSSSESIADGLEKSKQLLDEEIARLKSTLQLVKAVLSIHQNRDSNLDALLSKVTEALKPV